MKKFILLPAFALLLSFSTVFAQDIPYNAVPQPIQQQFEAQFSKAHDVEWEKDWKSYKVEFETGLLGADHEVWFDQEGNIVRHDQEIAKKDLPQAVTNAIAKQYDGFRISSPEKVTQKGETTYYRLELKSFTQEWDVVIDENGKILQALADD